MKKKLMENLSRKFMMLSLVGCSTTVLLGGCGCNNSTELSNDSSYIETTVIESLEGEYKLAYTVFPDLVNLMIKDSMDPTSLVVKECDWDGDEGFYFFINAENQYGGTNGVNFFYHKKSGVQVIDDPGQMTNNDFEAYNIELDVSILNSAIEEYLAEKGY